MPKPLQKSLQHYLSKIQKPSTPHFHLPSKPDLSSSTSWILRGCKHPKALSFSLARKQDNDHDNSAATLSEIGHFLFENFKSLYRKVDDVDDNENKLGDENGEEQYSEGYMFDSPSPRSIHPPPDLCGSTHRFFVESGSSSSLIMSEDMVGSSSTTNTSLNDSTRPSDVVKEEMGPEDFIMVLTYSKNPYDDFRRSMQEMIEARLQHNGRADWGFMEELLFCYLNLNDKKSHKYILSAYVDMIVILR
ncbi:transcription repressor OFP14-like [Cornus florida]|uniref:transcription repressor OFP14-like n=1 Tax=Cornus florida TaxID=4283 RepID=UPI00289C95D8|nr:transcription repressor OFP14-like [Cornus florida]